MLHEFRALSKHDKRRNEERALSLYPPRPHQTRSLFWSSQTLACLDDERGFFYATTIALACTAAAQLQMTSS